MDDPTDPTEPTGDLPAGGASYREAGVDLDVAERAHDRIARAVASTATPGVVSAFGSFGGVFRLPEVRDPVLIASTDGVGTKTMVAAALGAWREIGRDLVNHCVNDVAVQGAAPLFFLDYLASARLDPEVVGEVVEGIAEACREAGVALLGGETAEMPGVYVGGELDVVGTVVGIASHGELPDPAAIAVGDALIGLPSGGLQTNGFSLARAVTGERWNTVLPGASGATVGRALLAPHRSFLAPLRAWREAGILRGAAHVTGGGIPGNLPRVLPAGAGAEIDPAAWHEPPIFGWLRREGAIAESEMRRVFNLGIGLIAVVSPPDAERATELVPGAVRMGRVVDAPGVRFV